MPFIITLIMYAVGLFLGMQIPTSIPAAMVENIPSYCVDSKLTHVDVKRDFITIKCDNGATVSVDKELYE